MWSSNLGSFPYRARMFAILLDKRQDACRDNAMGFAKVVVDFCSVISAALAWLEFRDYWRSNLEE